MQFHQGFFMHASNFDLPTYLQRIGYTGNFAGDTTTLHSLMRQQLFTVPFENLDVQAGKVVSLIPEDIADKILQQGRGGYCYEVNGLFAMALQALGIPYQFAAARPMFYPARRPRTHMAVPRSKVGAGCAIWVSAATASEHQWIWSFWI
jgi:N-hydroxyarylamine O-acetyltransferase